MNHTNTLLHHLKIDGLTHDGRGVGKRDGKAVFVTGAVPGDVITARVTNSQAKFDEADLVEVETASPDRVEPFCDMYAQCGGCQLQHLDINAQRHWKHENFIKRLMQSVNAQACQVLPPIVGQDTQYRRRARFGLAINKQDKQPRLGFRQKASEELVDIQQCPILTPVLNQVLANERENLLKTASRAYKEIPLVEADNGVFGLPTPTKEEPFYALGPLQLHFPADGFIQINREINQKMVAQALQWLELSPTHQVLDLFCGVGNFTLPIAQHAESVVGVEGLETLVNTAAENAHNNQLKNTAFYKADLFKESQNRAWFKQKTYDRILLDPGRQGALQICKELNQLKAELIVYVSCNAATLIRDVQALEKSGYHLTKAGLIDMFPHTTHTEVMVQLKRSKKPLKSGKPKRRKLQF
ncbi:23S rRNA (uracil(1939)-C(5))-methyltransferase RlmD [Thiomicrorhabdus sp. zzn3]|uniref:23S rRNA (uracil(1939)-C(5))-methyltransferase RlmD n=1 Tax=Thiomicrorhabdus sp. zzn3 TaxID=3039775 RepID=UPI002436D57A|nr:23S rRNA (uracil(1939)-C(5))-methyltransferase RlmD [Thiomicrorhabdus sp. zzn3]MDG6778357.1 23S rRNA (uracil(1939)-C(5))-methyltransferase RlmD [Thiomicrorhabdus sp. zzn3]